MENQALVRLEALREVAWNWRAGCRESGPSGSGRGGWCPLYKGLAAYFMNKFGQVQFKVTGSPRIGLH
jgi:hypothetical protein